MRTTGRGMTGKRSEQPLRLPGGELGSLIFDENGKRVCSGFVEHLRAKNRICKRVESTRNHTKAATCRS